MKNENFPPELDLLCLTVGKFIDYWGFKEIEGRIWCHLFLSHRPLCAKDIMERTSISKALVSISLARLLEFNVVRVEFIEGKKTQYFQINEDVTSVIRDVLRHRERRLLSNVESSLKLLKELNPEDLKLIDSKRLLFMQKMVNIAKKFLDAIIFKDRKVIKLFFGSAPSI